jgi:MarR-like DNA-binding transcriptional regulator SgrR of sgrS sRNA
MKRSGLLLLVAASLVAASACLALSAMASTRPHYGGTLHLALRDAPTSLDPADPSQPDSFSTRSLSRLVFDTLVVLDERGQAQPALASSWQVEPGNQRWQFSIRRGVTFQDGTAVSADAVAASLRSVNPNWKVFSSGEAVVVECDAPAANLPAILALTRYGIAKRAGGKVIGSGPFSISVSVNDWEPGKKLVLTARDDYWGGRTFLDRIEIEMGKSFREQMILLDLGKADVVEVAPDQARHAAVEGRRVGNAAAAELITLVFTREPQSIEDGKLRQALGFSIDRESMNGVLLQGGGEPAGPLLPGWMSGYAFLFPTGVDIRRAQLTRGEVPQAPAWTLGYDASDPLARIMAERIALNARDAGLRLQPGNSAADVRLVRVPLASLDARVALTSLAARLGLPQPRFGDDSPERLYLAENTILQSQRVIPLLYLRSSVALSAGVRGWTEDRDGEWQLHNVWLGTEKP